MRIGVTIVHLSALDAERELAYKLADSGARTLVTTNLGPLTPMALRLREAGHLDHVIVGDDGAWDAATPQPLPDGILSFSQPWTTRPRPPPGRP